MRVKPIYLTPVLVAAAALAAVVASPAAAAAPTPLPKICIEAGVGSVCRSHLGTNPDYAVLLAPYGTLPYPVAN
jgi:hypothetical protein